MLMITNVIVHSMTSSVWSLNFLHARSTIKGPMYPVFIDKAILSGLSVVN